MITETRHYYPHVCIKHASLFLFQETGNFFLNSGGLESSGQLQLVGAIIGLAIYNGVILDVHFPRVLYKKLLGGVPTLQDLKEAEPVCFLLSYPINPLSFSFLFFLLFTTGT